MLPTFHPRPLHKTMNNNTDNNIMPSAEESASSAVASSPAIERSLDPGLDPLSYPSVEERYYSLLTDGQGGAVRLHSNRICLVGVDVETHPAFKDKGKKVVKIDFQVRIVEMSFSSYDLRNSVLSQTFPRKSFIPFSSSFLSVIL